MKNVKMILSGLLVILWMGMIFYFSNQSAIDSGSLSTGIIRKVLEVVDISKKFDPSGLDHLFRKSAHFFVYFILGILVLKALKQSGLGGHRVLIIALIICVLYAISDEFHQTFVPGRSGEIWDVVIDSLGSLLGIILYYYIDKKIRNGACHQLMRWE